MSNRGSYKPSQEADAYHARSQFQKSHVPPIIPAKKKQGSIVRFEFGKYKGRDIQEIRFKDRNYFDWAYKTVDRFRELVDAMDAKEAPAKRTRVAKERPERAGLAQVPYNPDHVTREGWNGSGPCHTVESYRLQLADEPMTPYLHPRDMFLDPTFDPFEAIPDTIPWQDKIPTQLNHDSRILPVSKNVQTPWRVLGY